MREKDSLRLQREKEAIRAEIAEREAQRLQLELSTILLSLEDLTHLNANWLSQNPARNGSKDQSLPVSAPFEFPFAPFQTPTRAQRHLRSKSLVPWPPSDDNVVVVGSVIKVEKSMHA